jgi:hypothetical protein
MDVFYAGESATHSNLPAGHVACKRLSRVYIYTSFQNILQIKPSDSCVKRSYRAR